MDFVKSQVDRIQRQLNGLSASQKMLTASLVAIMVMTLMMWGRYAGESEYVPLLEQTLSPDELTRIGAELDNAGITHKPSGNRILVPDDKRLTALGHISYSQALPHDFSASFDEVIKSLNPFDPSSVSAVKLGEAKNRALSQIISAFEPVKGAVVMIDNTSKRSIGGDVEPSATITIWMKRKNMPADVIQKTVNAAADVVVGAQAGLKLERVKVNVDSIARKVLGADPNAGPDGGEQMATIQQNENWLRRKIEDHLTYIPNVIVSVTVDVDTERTEAVSDLVLPGPVSAPAEESEESTETNGGLPAAGEAGVGSNTSMEINAGNAAGGTGGSSTQSSTRTKFDNQFSHKKERKFKPAGSITPLTASVQVPRSFFVNVIKGGKADAAEPDEKTVDARVLVETPKIRQAVFASAKFKSLENITVEMYPDFVGGGPQFVGAPETATASSVSFAVGGHAKEIALGVLAAVSLFMVSMMVRKASPAPLVVARAAAPSGPITLDASESVAGEVGGGDALLEGMELTDEAIKTQQMLDQVGTLVTENPDAAAVLVKRWMNRN